MVVVVVVVTPPTKMWFSIHLIQWSSACWANIQNFFNQIVRPFVIGYDLIQKCQTLFIHCLCLGLFIFIANRLQSDSRDIQTDLSLIPQVYRHVPLTLSVCISAQTLSDFCDNRSIDEKNKNKNVSKDELATFLNSTPLMIAQKVKECQLDQTIEVISLKTNLVENVDMPANNLLTFQSKVYLNFGRLCFRYDLDDLISFWNSSIDWDSNYLSVTISQTMLISMTKVFIYLHSSDQYPQFENEFISQQFVKKSLDDSSQTFSNRIEIVRVWHLQLIQSAQQELHTCRLYGKKDMDQERCYQQCCWKQKFFGHRHLYLDMKTKHVLTSNPIDDLVVQCRSMCALKHCFSQYLLADRRRYQPTPTNQIKVRIHFSPISFRFENNFRFNLYMYLNYLMSLLAITSGLGAWQPLHWTLKLGCTLMTTRERRHHHHHQRSMTFNCLKQMWHLCPTCMCVLGCLLHSFALLDCYLKYKVHSSYHMKVIQPLNSFSVYVCITTVESYNSSDCDTKKLLISAKISHLNLNLDHNQTGYSQSCYIDQKYIFSNHATCLVLDIDLNSLLNQTGPLMRTFVYNRLRLKTQFPIHHFYLSEYKIPINFNQIPFSSSVKVIHRQQHLLPSPYQNSLCQHYSMQKHGCISQGDCLDKCHNTLANTTYCSRRTSLQCKKKYLLTDCDHQFFVPLQSFHMTQGKYVQTIQLITQKEFIIQEPKLPLCDLILCLFGVISFWFELSVITIYRFAQPNYWMQRVSSSSSSSPLTIRSNWIMKIIRHILGISLLLLTCFQLYVTVDDYLNTELRSHTYIQLNERLRFPEISICQPNHLLNGLKTNVTHLDSQSLSQLFPLDSSLQILHAITQIMFFDSKSRRTFLNKRTIIDYFYIKKRSIFFNLVIRNFVYLNLNCIGVRVLKIKKKLSPYIFDTLALKINQTNLYFYVHPPYALYMNDVIKSSLHSQVSYFFQSFYEMHYNYGSDYNGNC